MNRILVLVFIAPILLTSCSKKDDHNPVAPITSVTINGKAYNTVVIGGQTWTSQNYDGPGGIIDSTLDESTYGKYYNIPEMESIALPSGWRVPSADDFTTLLKSQGSVATLSNGTIKLDSLSGAHLRSTSHWIVNGDNKSGFNAQPAGVCVNTLFEYQTGYAAFWSTTASTVYTSTGSNSALELSGGETPSGLFAQTDIVPLGYSDVVRLSLRFVKDN